ncbi:Nudix hydrolase isoform 2 [Theobroma cacao]|uniref:Nudix hydrolase isoform 2 n=1 Tax=Theobroma cacao TaxID=3641 RepID=A0A061GNJ7_THECC|nr:Nudix hydrolase isoform 2 [Theobroma cacao]
MSMSLNSHAFAGNPLRSKTPKTHDPFSPSSAFESLKTRLLQNPENHPPPESPLFKVLPFRKGRPLASSSVTGDDVVPSWHLGWISLADCEGILGKCGRQLREESLVYLGSRAEEDVVYWAIDVSEEGWLVPELGGRQFCFVELRTLMVATDWADSLAMGELAVAGHARALLEWHNLSRFCGRCGEKTVPKEAGRRKQCSNELCKIRVYPRVDPVYHSSQPWPVGPSSIPCQLMVGFFAYAKSLEIDVDKEELEDAQWHSREDVRKALTFAEYKKAQRTAATKVDQMCKGVERGQSLSADFNVESGELAPMFIPGPFAIAYHLISTWANEDPSTSAAALLKQPSSSISNL